MSKRLRTISYLVADWLAAALAWTIFYYYRKTEIDSQKIGSVPEQIFDQQFLLSIAVLPAIWVLV